jgi:WD40 repeat protein
MSPLLPPHMSHMGLEQHPIFALSPAADFVVTAIDPAPGSSPPGIYFMIVWNAVTGKAATEMAGVDWPLYAFSARGNGIAVSGFGGTSVIDIETGRELHRYGADRHAVRSLSFSPDAKWIASGHDDGLVRIWKVDRSRHAGYRRPKRA